ncbi:MAG TPA: hypothetical protein PL110_00440 [Candidatus Eremiobacteraeota bacterium]|nr:MAG: hypothetical protein BWY64_00986 [bacterium ADurb.Bin363]HPZ06554.1 hypothetical protein [Candidatus Eremiobacteraeota bacterium]
MDPHESYKLIYQILSLIRYLFIAIPAVIFVSTVMSLFNFKNKTLRKMFNYRDVTNSLSTLFPLMIFSILILFFCLTGVVEVLKSTKVEIKPYPLLHKVILPIFNLKIPSLATLLIEIFTPPYITFPLLVIAFIVYIVKWKDTASKVLIIVATANLFIILFTYKLFCVYYELYAIRMLH